MKKILFLSLGLLFAASSVLANQFYPEFDGMKTIRCDISETLYNEDNSVVSQTQYHRIFNLDDPSKKIYLQKAPVDWLVYYGDDKIKFTQQPLADDYMMTSYVVIDRTENKYTSKTEITYDNPAFGIRHAEASGVCRELE